MKGPERALTRGSTGCLRGAGRRESSSLTPLLELSTTLLSPTSVYWLLLRSPATLLSSPDLLLLATPFSYPLQISKLHPTTFCMGLVNKNIVSEFFCQNVISIWYLVPVNCVCPPGRTADHEVHQQTSYKQGTCMALTRSSPSSWLSQTELLQSWQLPHNLMFPNKDKDKSHRSLWL